MDASSRTPRLLVIGPSNIGDAILMSEVIAQLHARYPQGHLALVVGERACLLFADDPRIHSLVDFSAFDSAIGRLRLAWALWRYQPHVVVDLRHTAYPLLLKPLSAWRYLLQPPRTMTHMRDRYQWRLAAQVPACASRLPMGEGGPLHFTERDVAQVEALWKRWQVESGGRLVVVCPGARSHIKRGTGGGFARVADRLVAEAGARILFSGEPSEEPVIEEILALMDRPARSAVGLLTIRQLGLVMRRAALVLTNDSASLHLASALDVPTVAIFGPTDDGVYGPTASRSRIVRRALFCAPCRRSLCRFNHECMRFIGPDEVYDAAVKVLQRQ